MVKRCEWWGYLHHILAYFFLAEWDLNGFYDGVMMNIRQSCHLWGLTPSWILNIFGTWGPIRLIIMIGKSMILKDIRGFLPIILRYLRQIVRMQMPWNWPCLYEQYICCIGQQENFQNHIFNETVTPKMWNTRGRKHRETFITIFSNRQFNPRNFPQLSFPPFFPNSHASPKNFGFFIWFSSSWFEVNEVHAQFVAELQRIFQKHKGMAQPGKEDRKDVFSLWTKKSAPWI